MYGQLPISARRLTTLIEGLPDTSATVAALSGAWNPDRTLTGVLIERLDALTTVTVRAAGGKAKNPTPIVPRPKVKSPARAVPTTAALDKLDRILAGGER